jgi:hypothetical protein
MLPHHHYILQFHSDPDSVIQADLARRGMRVLGFVPDSGLLVSTGAAFTVEGLDLTWAGPLDLPPGYRGERR